MSLGSDDGAGLSVETEVGCALVDVGVDEDVGLLTALEHLEFVGDRG